MAEKNFMRSTGLLDQCARAVKYCGARVISHVAQMACSRFGIEGNTVLFESFLGKRLDCNPKAIYDFLREEYPGKYRYIWVAERPSDWIDLYGSEDTEVVRFRSADHLKYACIANVLITNSPRSNELPFPKSQLKIQTWHGGGCYKKVGTALNEGAPVNRFITSRQFAQYDYFISSSGFFSQTVARGHYRFTGNLLECGMPRNDRLVNGDEIGRRSIRTALGLAESDCFVLFVPTWRDFGDDLPCLDVRGVKRAFERLGGSNAVMAKRGHYFSGRQQGSFDMDLDDYPDMQGLLLAADAVITDYSSVIWDYSFTYRPCFLFAPDLAKYEVDRGFDVDIHEWGFPVCESNEELIAAIDKFDERGFRSAMETHHAQLGSFEKGHACETVAKLIETHCFGNEEKE